MSKLVCRLTAVIAVAWMSLPLATHAQSPPVRPADPQDFINWYYAATFGTGIYTAGDRTLSVLPGLEWELPMNRRWTIRPYVDAGFGQELAGRESAWIYDFGVKSRLLLGRDQGVEFALVNSLTSAGYRPRGGPTHPFGYIASGLDITIPTEGTLFGRSVYIGFTPIYYYYFSRLNFAEFSDPNSRIGEGVELAVSILTRNPWSLKLFDVDRIGIAIRISGDVSGVSLFTSLPF